MTLFISDLHLGSPLFDDEIVIVDLLQSPKYDEIVLVGDILDVWEDDIESILESNRAIVEAIHKASIDRPVTYILGNHDPDRETILKYLPLVGVCEEYLFGKGVVTHGHQFDDLIIKYSWLAKIVFYIHWVCERAFGINVKAYFRRLFYSLSAKKDKRYYNDLIIDVEKNAIEKYSDYDYVIMGHTHLPKIVSGKTTYVNVGDWIHNRSYVIYDSSTNIFTLKT